MDNLNNNLGGKATINNPKNVNYRKIFTKVFCDAPKSAYKGIKNIRQDIAKKISLVVLNKTIHHGSFHYLQERIIDVARIYNINTLENIILIP
jgi:hypothetical protein